MSKMFVRGCFMLAAGLIAVPSFAVLDTVDPVPGATLLIPYFEVDPADPDGVTTLFSINNASATAVLAHVTVWTDQSIPSLDFDVYLTGYDVQTVNMRDILVNGNLPRTASDGQDPSDTISPQGPLSQDINFASCAGNLPYVNPQVSTGFRSHLQAWHSGLQSPITGNCAGSKTGDGILRGYLTVDTTSQCSLLFPSDAGYFGPGGTGVATNQNVLWGDWFVVNPAENFAEGYSAVHIEAAAIYGPGDYTFYGRYVGAAGTDNREGLATSFATRYATGGKFDGTDLTIWRDSNSSTSPAAYSCAQQGPAAWYPLGLTQAVVFDEAENIFSPTGCPSGDPTCTPDGFLIPNEAQRLAVGSANIPLPAGFEFGWIYLNLSQTPGVAVFQYSQNWVSWSIQADGRFALGLDAIQLDNVANPNDITVGAPGPL